MFVLIIWWILIIDCTVEFKIVYGNERVIITVPVHIKKMHHTKMIYKIIEKPVHADTVSTPSAAGQVSHNEEPAMPDAPHRTHSNGNQTVATTSRYRERGHGSVPVDQRSRGYGGDHSRGYLRERDPSKGSTAHGARGEGVRHKHYDDAAADHGPHRHVDSYRYGSHANGAVLQQLQHHVHGPRHLIPGHHVSDVWYGKQVGEGVNHIGGDHKRGHSVEAMHGHVGDVLRVAGDHEHGGMHFSDHKPMPLGAHKHGHFGDHKHVHFGDHKHGNFGDPKSSGHLGRHNFEPFGGHRFEHFGGVGRGNLRGAWHTQDTSGPSVRGQNQRGRPIGPLGAHQHSDNLHRNVAKFGSTGFGRAPGQYSQNAAHAASPGPNATYRELDEHGFPRLLHDHKFSNPIYGHHNVGGYQVQENVTDFDGIVPIVTPQAHPATTAQVLQVDHNYPSLTTGIGGGDTQDGMSSVSAIASPPTVNSVYYTLDPVVPYDDVALRSQRETV